MSIATVSTASARLQAIRDGLSPQEWTRFGGMVAVIVGLYVAGFALLAAAVPGHYVVSHPAATSSCSESGPASSP